MKRLLPLALALSSACCTTVDNRCAGDGEALAVAQSVLCGPGRRVADNGSCTPNGYCEFNSDCETAGDFCLVEWCYAGPDCIDTNRCTPRVGVGSICEADAWCAEGLRCDLPKDCGGYPCKASTCIEAGPPT